MSSRRIPPLGKGLARLTLMAALLALLPTDALAYIDPGYGALLLQILLSSLFGALFLARKTIRRVIIGAAGLLRGTRRSREHAQVFRSEIPTTDRVRIQHIDTSTEAPPPL
jgi:hypothetical protein